MGSPAVSVPLFARTKMIIAKHGPRRVNANPTRRRCLRCAHSRAVYASSWNFSTVAVTGSRTNSKHAWPAQLPELAEDQPGGHDHAPFTRLLLRGCCIPECMAAEKSVCDVTAVSLCRGEMPACLVCSNPRLLDDLHPDGAASVSWRSSSGTVLSSYGRYSSASSTSCQCSLVCCALLASGVVDETRGETQM